MLDGASGVVQVHVTSRCNLRCAMCYSWSGPDAVSTLPPGPVTRFVQSAADLGYRTLSISGGEPLLYRALPELLRAAKASSMATQVATPGMLARPRALDGLGSLVDRFAVSVDGSASTHDRSRGRVGAFDRMRSGLRAMLDAGHAVQAIVTVTRENLDELDVVLDFLLAEGVRSIQFHPIEIAGRASDDCPTLALGENDSARLLVWFHLQKALLESGAGMHLDLAHRLAIPQPAAPTLPTLVVETDGFVVPVSFGLDRSLGIGFVSDPTSVSNLAAAEGNAWSLLNGLEQRAWAALQVPAAPTFVQWPDWMVRVSANGDSAGSRGSAREAR